MNAQEKQKQAIERIMQGLHCSKEEATDIARADIEIDRGEAHDFDLSPEKEKIAKKFAHTGTRKTPTVYNFNKRERKPNELKESLIAQIADKLRELREQPIEIEIVNKSRQITFKVGNETFDLTIIQKRAKKNAE